MKLEDMYEKREAFKRRIKRNKADLKTVNNHIAKTRFEREQRTKVKFKNSEYWDE